MQKRYAVPVVLALAVAVTASECGDLTVPDPTPSTLELVSGGDQEGVVAEALTDTIVVRVLDQTDSPMSDVTVSWETASGSIAPGGATDASGETSAVWTLGTEAGSVSATAAVADGPQTTINATALPGPVEDLGVSPDSVAFVALGDTATVSAAATDAYGNDVSSVTATWHSRDTLIATVVSDGVVTAAGNGTTYVVGEANSASDSVRVTVAQVAATVSVAPDTATITVGDTLTLAASAQDANGHALPAPSFAWGSSVQAAATVDSAGLVTALARGVTLVSASLEGMSDTSEITVESDSATTANPVCPDGNETDLVGHWSALEFWDGGDDDITKGFRLLVTMGADSTGRIVQLVPEVDMSGDTTMVTDSAHVEWIGCSGLMTVWLVQQWVSSTAGGFGSAEMDYTVGADTLELVIDPDSQYGTFERVAAGARDADLYGDWILIRDIYQSKSNSADSVDYVAETGILTQLAVSSDGTIVYSEVDSVGDRYTDPGVWSAHGDTIYYYSMRDGAVLIPYSKPASDRWVFTFDDASWDFDGDGTDEAATETGTLALPDTVGLVGTWVADTYVLTNKADTTESVDLIAQGYSAQTTFGAQGDYTSEFTDPSSGTETMTGTYEAAGGYLWLVETDYVTFVELTHDGTNATVHSTAYYDFDDDGESEEAWLEVTLTKQ